MVKNKKPHLSEYLAKDLKSKLEAIFFFAGLSKDLLI